MHYRYFSVAVPLVTAFTSGLISAESNIRIRVAEDFSDSVVPGTVIHEKIMTFSPELRGDLYFFDQRTVEFRPEQRLPQGITFRVKVKLRKFFPQTIGEDTFEFDFHTMAQHLEIRIEEFRPYNDFQTGQNYITGSVLTADVADPEAVKSLLYAVQEGIKRPIVWDHAPDGKQHQFIVDSIQRDERNSEVLIHYDGTLIGAKQKGVEIFPVPSLGNFKVISSKVIQYPEQHVVVSFSDPIRR